MSSLLAKYEAKAKTMTDYELIYAIGDIKDTSAYNDADQYDTDYGRKIWAEYDAYTVELHRRRKENLPDAAL